MSHFCAWKRALIPHAPVPLLDRYLHGRQRRHRLSSRDPRHHVRPVRQLRPVRQRGRDNLSWVVCRSSYVCDPSPHTHGGGVDTSILLQDSFDIFKILFAINRILKNSIALISLSRFEIEQRAAFQAPQVCEQYPLSKTFLAAPPPPPPYPPLAQTQRTSEPYFVPDALARSLVRLLLTDKRVDW